MDDYRKVVPIAADPANVHKALTGQVDRWWTVQANQASEVGDVLTVRFGEPYFMQMSIRRSQPPLLLDWQVTASNMWVENGKDSDEWVGTTIHWLIEPQAAGCQLTLHHEGLVPAFSCFETCRDGWDFFLQSLKQFVETGSGMPHSTA